MMAFIGVFREPIELLLAMSFTHWGRKTYIISDYLENMTLTTLYDFGK